jgi:hypothetical protein
VDSRRRSPADGEQGQLAAALEVLLDEEVLGDGVDEPVVELDDEDDDSEEELVDDELLLAAARLSVR